MNPSAFTGRLALSSVGPVSALWEASSSGLSSVLLPPLRSLPPVLGRREQPDVAGDRVLQPSALRHV